MKKRSLNYLIILTLITLIVSCASFTKTTYTTLSISQATYDSVMSSTASLYAVGKITESQKAQIIEKGNLYMNAHNKAVTALLTYQSTESLPDQQAYLTQLSITAGLLADLITLVEPFIGGK